MPPASRFPIEVAVTPRFDVFYALYTLATPTPSPLDPWKERALLRLPRDFERVAKRVAPVSLFWPLLADALQATPGEMTFDEMLANLRALAPNDLKSNILTGIFHDRATVQSLLTRKKTIRQVLTDDKLPGADLLVHFGLRPYTASSPAASAMVTVLSDPEVFRDELALVLERFWQTGFRRDWAALERSLRADSFRLKELEETSAFADLAREIKLPITADDKAEELRPRSGGAIRYDRVDRCYLIPSAFNTRRWWARYEPKGQRATLYFPVWSESASANAIVEDDWKRPIPSRAVAPVAIDAEAVFRALGDTTRYAIASILARSPVTSADLSRSLKVSKPTITHHVHALRAAGLIREQTSGGSTKLSLNKDTVGALSNAAVHQLFSSAGDLELHTTRKRRR